MSEELLKKIEKNTRRAAENSAFITWVVVSALTAGVVLAVYGRFLLR